MKTSRGFTAIELLVTLVMVAILVSLGMPKLSDFILQNRVTGTANEMLALLARARQEAVTRGTFVTVAPVSGDWSQGALMFVNPRNLPTFVPGDTLGTVTSERLEVIDAPATSLTWPNIMRDGTPALLFISFDGRGRPQDATGAALSGRVQVCATNLSKTPCRELMVDTVGRMRVEKF